MCPLYTARLTWTHWIDRGHPHTLLQLLYMLLKCSRRQCASLLLLKQKNDDSCQENDRHLQTCPTLYSTYSTHCTVHLSINIL